MNQHNGLRRKLEKYAIPNLTLYLIICYGIGYLMQYLVPAGYQYLMLDPFLVLKGQVWRLVTWILIPPDSSNIFFVLITLYLYYSLGGLLSASGGPTNIMYICSPVCCLRSSAPSSCAVTAC